MEGSWLDREQTRERLVDALGELLSATPEQVDELLDQLQVDHLAGPDRSPDAFERGLELGLLVGLGTQEEARRALARD